MPEQIGVEVLDKIRGVFKPMLEKTGADSSSVVLRGENEAFVIGYFNHEIPDDVDVKIEVDEKEVDVCQSK